MRTFASFALALSLSLPALLSVACTDDPAGTYSAGGAGGAGGATASSSTTTTASSSTSSGTGGAVGTGGGDGGPVDKSAACAATFGDALTDAFGRLDGTVLAVVKPSDTQCPMPNSDHLIVEVTMNGAVYRMVVNIDSTTGDPDVQYLAIDHALPGPAWAEGWHTGLSLDYVNDLGVHANAFTPYALTDLANLVTDAIPLGGKVSVFAQSSGGSSAHLVHRNGGNVDGAIVLDPDGSMPKALLFHFSDQSF
jgi:hypothetical protein